MQVFFCEICSQTVASLAWAGVYTLQCIGDNQTKAKKLECFVPTGQLMNLCEKESDHTN